MKYPKMAGFTIIEVTLFLAISGLLLLVVVNGIGTNQRNAEFGDSMQGIASFLNQQFNAIQSGVNPRSNLSCIVNTNGPQVSSGSSTAGSAGACVLLGRMYKFNGSNNEITGYDLVGARDDTQVTSCSSALYTNLTYSGSSALTNFKNSCPVIITDPSLNTAPTYDYNWGTVLLNGEGRNAASASVPFNTTGSYNGVLVLGIFRDPSTGNIFSAVWQSNNNVTDNVNTQFCYQGRNGQYGGIYLGGQFQNGGVTQTGTTNLVNVKVDDPSCGQWARVS